MHEHSHTLLFHPSLVHFPIAFYFLELVLLLFRWAKKDVAYHRFALFSFRIGYLLMTVAMVAGYVDAGGQFPVPTPIRPHAFSALAVFGFYTLRAGYWQWAKAEGKFYSAVLLVSAIIGTALVFWTGFLGGKLVYE